MHVFTLISICGIFSGVWGLKCKVYKLQREGTTLGKCASPRVWSVIFITAVCSGTELSFFLFISFSLEMVTHTALMSDNMHVGSVLSSLTLYSQCGSFWSGFPWINIIIWMRSIAQEQHVDDSTAWWSERWWKQRDPEPRWLIMRENPCYVSKDRMRAALEPVLTQPLQLEREPTLQHSTTTSLGGRWAEPLFCIPLFQCIHIQKMLVVHWLQRTTWPSTPHYFIFWQKNHDLFWCLLKMSNVGYSSILSSLLPWYFDKEKHPYKVNGFIFLFTQTALSTENPLVRWNLPVACSSHFQI